LGEGLRRLHGKKSKLIEYRIVKKVYVRNVYEADAGVSLLSPYCLLYTDESLITQGADLCYLSHNCCAEARI
jgi:hypothetical protein